MRAHAIAPRWLYLPLLFAAVLAATSCTAAMQGTQVTPGGQVLATATPLTTSTPLGGQAIATATPFGTPFLHVTTTPFPMQQTPTPIVTSQFQVGSYTSYRSDTIPPFRLVGVATNKSDTPIYRVIVAVSLLDAQGNVVAAASNPAPIYVALPNMVVPFYVGFDSIPTDWQKAMIQVQGDTQATFLPAYLDLRAEGTTLQPAGSTWRLVGRVVNTGQSAAHEVRIAVAGYDSAGKVLDAYSGDTELSTISPGGTSPFTVYLPNTSEKPARYDVVVQGLSGPAPTP